MKRLFFSILFSLVAYSSFSQTGWLPIRSKQDFKDTVNFTKGFKINNVQVTLNGNEFNILDGALVTTAEINRLVGVTAPLQTQINDLQAQVDQTEQIVSDSVRAIYNSALTTSNYFWELNDTAYTYKQIITFNQLMAAISEVEGGGSTAYEPNVLQFTIGKTSGAPANGDSTVYHADLVSTPVFLWRGAGANMTRQRFNATATNGVTGYRKSGGTITVRPVFATGETVVIEPRDAVTYLDFGTSTMTNGLFSYWKFDETSGTTADDSHSTSDGVISTGVTLNQTGALNTAFDFNGTSSNVNFGTTCRLTSAITISLWFNTADISTEQQLFGNSGYGSAWCGYRVTIGNTGYINFMLGTNSGTVLDKSYSSGKDDGAWHHVACTWDGSNAYIYVDNVKSTASVMSTAIDYTAADETRAGSNGDATAMFYGGLLDEICVYNRALSDSEISTLYAKTPYPF